MTSNVGFSVVEKLLLAAYGLEGGGKRPFTAEDLVVAAWSTYPDTFSLSGYQDETGNLLYPDSNRVFAEIMGSKPIRKRGLLIKTGTKQYQLTAAGIEHARLLLNRTIEKDAAKSGLARETKAEIERLFRSKAYQKHLAGYEDEITFFDACTFWRISPRTTATELAGRIGSTESILAFADREVRSGDVSLIHGGSVLTRNDFDHLRIVNEYMKNRFESQLGTIRMRTDERV